MLGLRLMLVGKRGPRLPVSKPCSRPPNAIVPSPNPSYPSWPGKSQHPNLKPTNLIPWYESLMFTSFMHSYSILPPNDVHNVYVDGLVQERRNSSALAMELRLSCPNPSMCLRQTASWIRYCEICWVKNTEPFFSFGPLTCVESRDAKVISRLPFRPSKACSMMKISGTCMKASQYYDEIMNKIFDTMKIILLRLRMSWWSVLLLFN